MAIYRETHPWLTFGLDLRRVPWELWLLAGEAMSKCEHLAGVALRPEKARELMLVYLAKGARATTAIEGNTLSEAEVRQRIEGALKLPASKEYLGVEIDNIVGACNAILRGEYAPLTPEAIMALNREVLKGLVLETHIRPGEWRTYSVGVADYRGAPAQDLPELMGKLCAWLDAPWLAQAEFLGRREATRLEAILKAILSHLYLAWIHPFGDGNGRTARLVEVLILVNAGVPFPAAHLLSDHYNQTRSEYYRQLGQASRSGGDVVPFCRYALRGFVDNLREQINVIRDEQLKLFWQNHVHRVLGESATGRRRQHLVLDLAEARAPVGRDAITDLSPRVARDYASKHERTLGRDLDELEKLGLVEQEDGAYRAKTEVVLAYVPPSKAV